MLVERGGHKTSLAGYEVQNQVHGYIYVTIRGFKQIKGGLSSRKLKLTVFGRKEEPFFNPELDRSPTLSGNFQDLHSSPRSARVLLQFNLVVNKKGPQEDLPRPSHLYRIAGLSGKKIPAHRSVGILTVGLSFRISKFERTTQFYHQQFIEQFTAFFLIKGSQSHGLHVILNFSRVSALNNSAAESKLHTLVLLVAIVGFVSTRLRFRHERKG